jgi:Lysozyme like domain
MSLTSCRAAVLRYWPKDTQATALAIMQLESGGRADAHLYSDKTGDDSWGCFQVNRYGALRGRPFPDWLTDPNNNVQYAVGLYRVHGWQPWRNSAIKLGLLK